MRISTVSYALLLSSSCKICFYYRFQRQKFFITFFSSETHFCNLIFFVFEKIQFNDMMKKRIFSNVAFMKDEVRSGMYLYSILFVLNKMVMKAHQDDVNTFDEYLRLYCRNAMRE